MRIAIASDAWEPQTNGVVTTLRETIRVLRERGHEIRILSPGGHASIAAPSYPEIRLALAPGRAVGRELREFRPEAVHVVTEGPIGLAARRCCLRAGWPFTTAYHTRYPEYLSARWPIPLAASYAWLRRFHFPADRTFVSSRSLERQLAARGFGHLHLWRRGVDLARFHSGERAVPALLAGAPRPIMTYLGRLAVEKNIEAFLRAPIAGTKLLIGDGPQRDSLAGRYPAAKIAGYKYSDELAALLGASDVFVFPSLTDTFGLAMIEALACGTPVAAFPVAGPLDVIEQGVTGVLDLDLPSAIRGALALDRRVCAQRATAFTWEAATHEFLTGLAPIGRQTHAAADQPQVACERVRTARIAPGGRASAMIARDARGERAGDVN